MGATTEIGWTDATVNFWWGCTKVGPGCDHCYAERWAKRTGGDLWGLGKPRRKIKGAVALLHRLDNGYSWWSADHHIAGLTPTPRQRVFVQSMADLFDKEVPAEWFAEAWATIGACKRVDLQIVTKRIGMIEKRLAEVGCTTWPDHAGLILTVVNQQEADRDVPRLLALKQKLGIPWVGLSIEPMLGPITLTALREFNPQGEPWIDALRGLVTRGCLARSPSHCSFNTRTQIDPPELPCLDWVIVGGETGPAARPMLPAWVRALRKQCAAADVPFFFKQWGAWLVGEGNPEAPGGAAHGLPIIFQDGSDFDVVCDGTDIVLAGAQMEAEGPSKIWRDYYGWQGRLVSKVTRKRGDKGPLGGNSLDGECWEQLPRFHWRG